MRKVIHYSGQEAVALHIDFNRWMFARGMLGATVWKAQQPPIPQSNSGILKGVCQTVADGKVAASTSTFVKGKILPSLFHLTSKTVLHFGREVVNLLLANKAIVLGGITGLAIVKLLTYEVTVEQYLDGFTVSLEQ